METARDLFLFQGYHATGVSQILKQAEVNAGSLYYYFPTKEDLLLAVLEWYRDNIWEGLLAPVWERVTDPVERIFGLLNQYRQMLVMLEFQQGCPMGNLSLELVNTHPNARSLLLENFENWLEAIEKCLQEASDRLPEGLDRRAMAMHILTVMEGAVMMARTYRSIRPFDESVSQLRDHVERMVSDGTDWSHPRPMKPLEESLGEA